MFTPEKKKTFTTEEATPELLAQLKAKHGRIMQYKSKDGQVTAWFKNPDRTTLDATLSLNRSNPVKSDELLAKDCFLGGDTELLTTDKYFYGLRNFLGQLVEVAEGEFSEL